ncbi:MAG: 1,4-dihydroxy-2-naphthoate octaprenyltransferase [Paludibacteraceae bacterium]|nr:1,4-dihydroxy-2-naphthoate octaprenyltransferase [Paludibacteraceae bacterium]MBR4705231.1 1,4-dihydroxy-2-naphthoate octaprenyltransferase [Paludibacteraceae bacterium]
MSPYIQSLRLRTLPLSMSGIILGTGLTLSAYPRPLSEEKSVWVFVLAIMTTLSLQILSNLSNELGDAMKGTDTDQQGREAYGLQAGTLTFAQIKRMIALFIGLSVLFGAALVFTAFGFPISNNQASIINILVFLGLGLFAIIGAMTYTLGKHSYGYKGLGDLGVFLFFGLLSTLGSYYLQTQTLTWEVVWCGAAIGLPCVGVLNLNNIRDMNNDRAHGKHTLASALGVRGAKIYHSCLLVGCLAIFMMYGHWWALCVLPVWAWHLWFVWNNEGKSLDRQMPVLMLSTGLLACIGWL